MLSPVLAVTGFAASCTAVLLYVICTASDAWLVTTYPQRTNTGLWRHCVDETGCVAFGVHSIAAYVHIARALMISACIVGGFAVMLYAVFVRKSFNEKSIIASCTVIAFSGLLVLVAIIQYVLQSGDDAHGSDNNSRQLGQSVFIGLSSVSVSIVGSTFLALSARLQPTPDYQLLN